MSPKHIIRLVVTAAITVASFLSAVSMFSTMAFAAGPGSTPKGKPFIEIAGQIVEVQNNINTLESAHQEVLDRIEALDLDLQGQIDAINVDILALKAKDADLQASLSTVITTLQTQGTAIYSLLQNLSSVNLQIVALRNSTVVNSEAISNLETQQGQILADIAALDAGVVTAMTEISDNTSLIEMLADDIADLESNKQNDIVGSCPTGTSVSTVRDDGSLLCGTTNAAGTVVSQVVIGPYLDIDNTYTGNSHHCHEEILGLCINVHDHRIFRRGVAESYLSCPPGYTVTSGGYNVQGFSHLWVDVSVKESYPLNNDTWYIKFINGSTFKRTTGYSARAYAQCIIVQ